MPKIAISTAVYRGQRDRAGSKLSETLTQCTTFIVLEDNVTEPAAELPETLTQCTTFIVLKLLTNTPSLPSRSSSMV